MKISIIIATYNSSNTLRVCLDSVLEQDFQDWECVIIDGASKDSTVEIIKDYELKDSRFKHISEPDKGIYDALNKGMKMASGDWCHVLGSDDKLCKQGLATLMDKVDGDTHVVYGNIILDYVNKPPREIFPKELKKLRYQMVFSHQGVLVRREDMLKLGGFDTRYVVKADLNMMQQLYLSGVKFQYINVPIVLSGMTGLSNQYSSLFKYEKERYYICKRNKANAAPFLYFWYVELRSIAIIVRDVLLGRK